MTAEIEELKKDSEVKVGRKTVPVVLARLKKDVVVEDVGVIIKKDVIGCVLNEFGNLLFVIHGEVEGIQEDLYTPVFPDEIELL